ncbi:MAG: FAD:protein FMN transferase [Candidatus Marinimicrobia bacterium]|nr:FAD:protein FMN transferase [Candidatus Neomarinimicrobiota bacterium]MCF7827348.1 FAD:protein FMN transferase [Candidatus Neomarinimicrobiota bacterium]MCF7881419.1 FAD:protein FMN transferase [Candidatus Neomarinimicrobiota bacterium]
MNNSYITLSLRCFVFLVLVLSLTACNSSRQSFHFTKFAMDTVIDYTVMADSRESARSAMLNAHTEVQRVSDLLWEEEPGSEIFRFNAATDSIHTTQEVYELLSRAKQYFAHTKGAFDLSVKPALELYDFREEDAEPPGSELLHQTLAAVGFGHVQLEHRGGAYIVRKESPNTRLAVGGLAKGYAVDRAIAEFQDTGIEQALINAGGDLYTLGSKNGKPWKVGIQAPRNPDEIREVLAVKDKAVATSGDYQRYFMHEGTRYHHILDPENGKPVRGSQSATVLAPTTEMADAYATALFVSGPIHGIDMINSDAVLEGMIIDSSGTVYYSEGFPDYLTEP